MLGISVEVDPKPRSRRASEAPKGKQHEPDEEMAPAWDTPSNVPELSTSTH